MLKHWINGHHYSMMLMEEAEKEKTGGADPEDGKTAEMKAIEAIGHQIQQFKSLLGEKAKSEDFENVQKELNTLKDGLETLTAKEVERQIKAINDANEKIHKQIVEMQEELAQQKESGKSEKGKKPEMISRKQVEDFVKTIYPDGKNGDKRKFSDAKIEIKAAETFGSSVTFASGADATAFTGRRVDPTLYQRRRKSNIILDYFNIQTIDVPTLIYLRKIEVGTGTAPNDDPGGTAWIL